MTITPEQVRKARGLLGWSQVELSVKSGIAFAKISGFEGKRTDLSDRQLQRLSQVLEAAQDQFVAEVLRTEAQNRQNAEPLGATIRPDQWRAARGLLGMPRAELAKLIGISIETARRYEAGVAANRDDIKARARAAFEAAGIEFVAEPGEGPEVRLRSHGPTILPAQWRAARALLNWPKEEMARRIGAPFVIIMRLETGRAPVPGELASKARAALEGAGVIFVEENGEGPGVRLRKAK